MSEQFSTTHEHVPLIISTNKKWYQFWAPKEVTLTLKVTVNRDLGVAIMSNNETLKFNY